MFPFVIHCYFISITFKHLFYILLNIIFEGYNNQYGSISESNVGMAMKEDSIGYDPNNSVFETDPGGHYNNIPNPMISNTTTNNASNPVVMMQMTTPLPQTSGQGDSYGMGAPRAVFDEDEHQRQLMLMQQGMGDQPPIMQRPKSSMSGHQSRGLFHFHFINFKKIPRIHDS